MASPDDINRVVQNAFLITLGAGNLGFQGPANAVCLSSDLQHMDKPVFDLQNVSNRLFERIHMSATKLTANVVINRASTGPVRSSYGSADQREIVFYLGESFIRLQSQKRFEDFHDMQTVFSRLEGLIFQNLRLRFQEPDLYEDLPMQFLNFYFREWGQNSHQVTAFTQKFLGENISDFDSTNAGIQILTVAHVSAKNLRFTKIGDEFEALLHLALTFTSDPELVKIFMQYCSPKNPENAVAYEQSLLGNLLRLSCLPENNGAPCEFFENEAKLSQMEMMKLNQFISTNTVKVTEFIFRIFDNIVRKSADMRAAILHGVSCI